MIEVNERECALQCSICKELEGVSRKAIETPEILEKLKVRVARQHEGCLEFEGRTHRAQVERQFRRKIEAELRGIGV